MLTFPLSWNLIFSLGVHTSLSFWNIISVCVVIKQYYYISSADRYVCKACEAHKHVHTSRCKCIVLSFILKYLTYIPVHCASMKGELLSKRKKQTVWNRKKIWKRQRNEPN